MKRSPIERKSPLLSHQRPKKYRPRQRTRAEREHHDAVAALGCLICQSPAEIHHLRVNPETGRHMGLGERASHFHVIPLCPGCHRLGGYGVAYHAAPRHWQEIHGSEIDLWRRVQVAIGLMEAA